MYLSQKTNHHDDYMLCFFIDKISEINSQSIKKLLNLLVIISNEIIYDNYSFGASNNDLDAYDDSFITEFNKYFALDQLKICKEEKQMSYLNQVPSFYIANLNLMVDQCTIIDEYSFLMNFVKLINSACFYVNESKTAEVSIAALAKNLNNYISYKTLFDNIIDGEMIFPLMQGKLNFT